MGVDAVGHAWRASEGAQGGFCVTSPVVDTGIEVHGMRILELVEVGVWAYEPKEMMFAFAGDIVPIRAMEEYHA